MHALAPPFSGRFSTRAITGRFLATIAILVATSGQAALAGYFGFSAGTAAGLLAGGLTESAAIGTAGDAIAKLAVDEGVRRELTDGVAIAFAVTYLVGLVTSIASLVKIAPWLMRVDLADDCRKLEAEMGVTPAEPGVVSAYREFIARAYSIPTEFGGATAAALEAALRRSESSSSGSGTRAG